jgi:NAD(P)-dependent dehydrogenase (short-subunit alcohol dehydrogenase family)
MGQQLSQGSSQACFPFYATGHKIRMGETAYSVAKAAMVDMSRSLAIEVAKYGITVNNVAPGWIATGSSTEEEKVAAENTLMGRAGTPEEVGDLIVFVESSAIAPFIYTLL